MMKFALFLTITLVDMSVVLSYEMARNNFTVCPERHSCRNSNESDALIYCKCDSLCEAYDDCCDDYRRSRSGPNSTHNNTFNLTRNDFSCKQLFYRDDDYHYTVDRCPKGWRQKRVKAKCRSAGSSSGNTIAKVPVVGRQSSILYRNVYCAFCNGEQDVVFSKGYAEGRSTQVDLNRMEFLYPEGYNLRTCINAIRTCNSSYRGREVKRRCTGPAQSNSFVNSGRGKYLYFVEIMLWDTTFYRNADCAKCNFVNEPKQMCNYDLTRSFYPAIVPPFKKLINFNRNTIETTNNLNGRSNTETFRCSSGLKYDPIKKKCLIVFST